MSDEAMLRELVKLLEQIARDVAVLRALAQRAAGPDAFIPPVSGG